MANPFSVDIPQFNALQELMGGYGAVQGIQRDRAIDDAANAIRLGDNDAAIEALFKARQIGPAIEFAKLNRQQEASNQFSNDLAGVFGGGQPPGMPAGMPPAGSPASPIARLMAQPVPSASQPGAMSELPDRAEHRPLTGLDR